MVSVPDPLGGDVVRQWVTLIAMIAVAVPQATAIAADASEDTPTQVASVTKQVTKTVLNRCGEKYTWRTAGFRLRKDTNTPPIQKVRVRQIPHTRWICGEFTRVLNDEFKTQSHQINIYDTSEDTAPAMICGARRCAWKSDDWGEAKFWFFLQAKHKTAEGEWFSRKRTLVIDVAQ